MPVYLMHRYQLQAAATLIGGQDFTYALRGDGQVPVAAPAWRAHYQLGQVQQLLEAPGVMQGLQAHPAPPGSPI